MLNADTKGGGLEDTLVHGFLVIILKLNKNFKVICARNIPAYFCRISKAKQQAASQLGPPALPHAVRAWRLVLASFILLTRLLDVLRFGDLRLACRRCECGMAQRRCAFSASF